MDRHGRLQRELFSAREQILFVEGIKKSGEITQEARDRGAQVIQSMLNDSRHLGVQQTLAVATEAFRRASNGDEIIQHYREQFGLHVQLLSPQAEALLGFNTAYAYADDKMRSGLVAWDCGAGSFQLTSRTQHHADCHGSGTIKPRGLKRSDEHGRISADGVRDLLRELRDVLTPIPQWAREPTNQYVAIGSNTSIFNQMRRLSGLQTFAPSDVESALVGVTGLSHDEIWALEKGLDANVERDNAPYVVAKLSLLLTVMQQCDMDRVQFHITQGNCTGLLLDPSAWNYSKN